MDQNVITGAKAIRTFCQFNLHAKRELPLRASQISALIYALDNENGFTPADAAQFFKFSKPVVTKIMKPLLEQGYLEKIPSTTDKRSYTLKASIKAHELVKDADQE